MINDVIFMDEFDEPENAGNVDEEEDMDDW